MLIVVDYEEENVVYWFLSVLFFLKKLQTNILIFSKKPNQIESQYFHQHQILRLFIVCMKP